MSLLGHNAPDYCAYHIRFLYSLHRFSVTANWLIKIDVFLLLKPQTVRMFQDKKNEVYYVS